MKMTNIHFFVGRNYEYRIEIKDARNLLVKRRLRTVPEAPQELLHIKPENRTLPIVGRVIALVFGLGLIYLGAIHPFMWEGYWILLPFPVPYLGNIFWVLIGGALIYYMVIKGTELDNS